MRGGAILSMQNSGRILFSPAIIFSMRKVKSSHDKSQEMVDYLPQLPKTDKRRWISLPVLWYIKARCMVEK